MTPAEFVRSKTMNCKGCKSNNCSEVCQLWQKEHDTAIRNATLDKFFDELQERLVNQWIILIGIPLKRYILDCEANHE